MSALLPLARFGRVALAAAVVAISGLAVLPAAAHPYFTGPYLHRPVPHPFFRPYFPIYPQPYFPVYPQVCLPDWQVRQAVEDQGYYGVSLYASTGIYVRGRASRAGLTYWITVNRCSGDVVSVQLAR